MLNSSDLLSKPVEELKNIVKEKRKSGDDEDRDKEKARVKREKLEADEEADGPTEPLRWTPTTTSRTAPPRRSTTRT
jgi:hypothetical protein